MPPPVTTTMVDLNGVRLFTRSIGDGHPCVVLHGGPGAHHDYLLPQFDDLHPGRELKYYDQRGGGQSPVEYDADVRWERHVDDLAALLDYWALTSVPLLGYSWGGLLAMLFAIHHPDRLTHLALVSPAPATAAGRRVFEERFRERSSSPEVAQMRAELQASGLKDTDPDAYRQRAFEISVAGYFADPGAVKNLTPFRVTGRTQKAVWESLGDYDLRPELENLQLPAVVLHGHHDPIPMDTARDTASRLGADLIVMPDSGHCPYIENRALFASTLDEFLPRT